MLDFLQPGKMQKCYISLDFYVFFIFPKDGKVTFRPVHFGHYTSFFREGSSL